MASNDNNFAQQAAQLFHHSMFRCYTSSDLIAVEIGGAFKNILAIAAGIIDGLEFGANARAALITRGIAEMTRLGRQLHANTETFSVHAVLYAHKDPRLAVEELLARSLKQESE